MHPDSPSCRMQWPDARTCRQPGHAACPTPRLTSAVIVLLAGLLFLGTLPTLTIAMSLPSRPRGPSSSASFSLQDGSERPHRAHTSTGNEHLQADAPGEELKPYMNLTHLPLTNQERQSRSLSFSGTVHNKVWAVFQEGSYIHILPNGTVGTTKELYPAHGLLQMTSLPPTQVNISLFGGEKMDPRATLKVIRANKFLCMNRKGTFYARDKVLADDCAFRKITHSNFYTTLCREKERKNKRKRKEKICNYVCMGINSKGQLKRYCETAAETFLQLLPEKRTEKGIFTSHHFTDHPPIDRSEAKSTQTPGPDVPSKSRKRKGKRRKGRRRLADRLCHGLFCKYGTDRPVGEVPRQGRDHRRRRRRRKNRQRRRQRQKRPRRAEMTPEEGPFANVT